VPVHSDLFAPTVEGEARLLLLIDAFTGPTANLEGRTKLAKLDFLLRYPAFLRRAIAIRKPDAELPDPDPSEANIEQRMVRYRHGPWDPAYFALLGSLIGRGLIVPVSHRNGVAYRTTPDGHALADDLARTVAWQDVAQRTRLLKRHFGPVTGTFMKDFVYRHFPEVAQAGWHEPL
jgi:hypothetical protein